MNSTTDQYAAFRHKSYQRYFTSRFLTGFSLHILTTTIGFHLYDITDNPVWLGLVGVILFAPSLLLVVVTGMAADRLNRRAVMAGAILTLAASAAIVTVLALTGQFDPLWVMGAMFLVGIGRAFHSPASSSLVVNLVPKEDFGQYKEYSVIHTNRSLNLMSDPFQRVMRNLNDLLKETYNADKVAIIPG